LFERIFVRAISTAILAIIGMALAMPVLADPGHGHGKGQGQGSDNGQGHGNGPPGRSGGGPGQPYGQVNIVISPYDRTTVYNYYRAEYVAGHCPPGLAKKHNGCLPPGQAKKLWVIGQPLPVGVVYYPLPPVLLGQLSPAPAGYQYVRVANDILLMAVGTRLIAGALADLSSF
jgi:hypothetical protein